MKKLAFAREQMDDPQQARLQEQARLLFTRINENPLLRGRLVSVRFISGATPLVVTHRLGVVARCFPVSLEYEQAIHILVREHLDQSGIDTKNQMRLYPDQPGTIDLWFYPRSSVRIPDGKTQAP